jgi:tartronate-semialdehyde synthase
MLSWPADRTRSITAIESAVRNELAKKLMAQFRVPVVVEIVLERITNIAMGTELDNVVEFEELAERREDAPTAVSLLD